MRFDEYKHLTSLKLFISTDDGLYSEDCRDVLSKGRLSALVASLESIEELEVHFDKQAKNVVWIEGDGWPAQLDSVLKPGHLWPKLRTFCFEYIVMKEEDLLDVILRHKDTLQTCYLWSPLLTSGSWDSFTDSFNSHIGGQVKCYVDDALELREEMEMCYELHTQGQETTGQE